MGVLAALVSDAMFPLTFEQDTAGARLRKQVEDDIDKHLKSYQTRTGAPQLEYIRNPVTYFEQRNIRFADARKFLESDYSRGDGYNGYAKSSTPAAIQATVAAVADVWFTVMRPEGDLSDVRPSEKSLMNYYKEQVVYHLRQNKNLREAERAYKQFAAVKSNSLEAYEEIGDAFYAFGPDGRERAVQEWTNALTLSGARRNEVKKKLATHYLGVGKDFLTEATKPNAPKDALPNALDNFTKALEFDQSNQEAADLINETQIQIADRDQRLEIAIRTLSAAESVVQQAEKSKVDQQFTEAIAQYKKAITVFEQVGDEFTEQADAASEGKEDAKLRINQIVKSVLDLASDRIEDGERLKDQKKFDDAIDSFSGVETLLKVVPEDIQGSQKQEKETLIQQANEQIADTEKAKRADAELQKANANVAGPARR
jgi:tetratricopeptide (TPR) repeat protein